MNSIIDIEKIIQEKIDQNDYLNSLLFLSLKYNLLTDNLYNQIIFKLLMLLTNRIKEYTGGLTSSVPIKLAKNINNSNIWVIGLYLKEYSIKKSLDILLKEDINKTYKLAKNKIDNLLKKTKLFYKVIFQNNILKIDNYFYRETLINGIKEFFKRYNPDYNAEDILINADYDVYLERPSSKGIEFIQKYLEYLNYENLFLKKFPLENIINILQRIYPNYEDILINIFEIILTTVIILEYLKKDIYLLETVNLNTLILYDDFSNNVDKYKENLKKAYINLKEKLDLENDSLNYLDRCADKAIFKILIYTKNNNLEYLLGQKQEKKIFYKPLSKMDDNKYIEILNILNKASSSEKMYLITNKVTSFWDIVEILEQVDLTSKELSQIFKKFPLIEVMALKKWYNDNRDNSNILDELNKYIYTLSKEKQKFISDNYNYIFIVLE